jgi:hypothetical protein
MSMQSAPRGNRKNPPRGSKTADAMMARAKVAAECARKCQHRLLKLQAEEKLKADVRAVQLQRSIGSMKRQLHRLRVLHSRKGNSISSLEEKIAREVLHVELRQVTEARSAVADQITTVEANVSPLIAEYEQIRSEIEQQLSTVLEMELHPTLFAQK